MNILVTGGAGYIGAITAKILKNAGHNLVIFDNLTSGKKSRAQGVPLIVGDTSDQKLLEKTFAEHDIEAVIHFAAFIEAGESMQEPGKYFANNTFGTLSLLEAMVRSQVKQLVFSSTAAVYGIPQSVPIAETAPLLPISPYGESKLAVERMLRWYDQIHDLRWVAIRYFNAAGAALDGSLGEEHDPETHLIPNVIKAMQEGREFKLFGNDYNTPDGTCIRDYIHVEDLATAHIAALDGLAAGRHSDVYNAGTGKGYSNHEVIAMIEQVSGQKVNTIVASRRPGDPDELVADATKFQNEMGWKPVHSDLETIVKTAWAWHNR